MLFYYIFLNIKNIKLSDSHNQLENHTYIHVVQFILSSVESFEIFPKHNEYTFNLEFALN